jgi:endonuclease-3
MCKQISKELAKEVLQMLINKYGDVSYYFTFSSPFELFVLTILSQANKDENTRNAAQRLLTKYKSFEELSKASFEELKQLIYDVNEADRKARNLIAASKFIVERYNSIIPNRMEDLLSLPGIGRKTANNILINLYGIAEGIPVDIWVRRVSYRIGIYCGENPEELEQILMNLVPKDHWKSIGYVLKAHGKLVCNWHPQCDSCVLNEICAKNIIWPKFLMNK